AVCPTLGFTSVEDASRPTSFAADDTALTAFLAAGAAVCGEGDPPVKAGAEPSARDGRGRLDEYHALIAGRARHGKENGGVFTGSALGIIPAGRGRAASRGALVRPRAAAGPAGRQGAAGECGRAGE